MYYLHEKELRYVLASLLWYHLDLELLESHHQIQSSLIHQSRKNEMLSNFYTSRETFFHNTSCKSTNLWALKAIMSCGQQFAVF
ncbi:UNVERIFIED_CONTAM: hypothetical protein NCL1_03935 [Trichonephila clavipes]